MLAHQIESDLFRRQAQALTKFQASLPPPQSDLAQQALKDPYNSLAVDGFVRHAAHQPSIGLVLCKERNRLVVEYALRATRQPIGVSTC